MKPGKVKLLGAILGLTSVAVVFGIFSHRFFSDNFLITSSLIFGISILNLAMQPGVSDSQVSDAGWIGSIGVHAYFSFIGIGFGLTSIILSGFSLDGLSIAADGLSLLGIFLSYALSRMTKEAVERIDLNTNFQSSHLKWADELALASQSIKDSEIREAVLKLSEKARYLSRDVTKDPSPTNIAVEKYILDLKVNVEKGSLENANSILESISFEFARRESENKSSRRKA